MDYCCGGDLCSLLCTFGYLDEEMAIYYTSQIILAITYLHQKDIIHRDIKPENMLIHSTGRLKLSDFGLSAYSNDKNRKLSLTGTPGQVKSMKENFVFNSKFSDTKTPAAIGRNGRNFGPSIPFSMDESSSDMEVDTLESNTSTPSRKSSPFTPKTPRSTPRRKSVGIDNSNFVKSKLLGEGYKYNV